MAKGKDLSTSRKPRTNAASLLADAVRLVGELADGALKARGSAKNAPRPPKNPRKASPRSKRGELFPLEDKRERIGAAEELFNEIREKQELLASIRGDLDKNAAQAIGLSGVAEGVLTAFYESLERDFYDERHEQLQRLLPALAMITLRTVQTQFIKEDLDELVQKARQDGASWRHIARAAGISPQAAHRRWDADAKARHREYARKHYKAASGRETAE